VKTEPPAQNPDLASVLKDAEARLAEAEKRISSSTGPRDEPPEPADKEPPPAEAGAQTAPPAESPAAPPVEPPAKPDADLVAMLKDVEARLAETEKRAAEQYDACLRAKAETENTRRRAQEDVAKASKFAAEKFAAAILPVKDSLEAALATEGQTPEKLREGVELTLKQLTTAFESANLTEENPLGQKFDPNKHEAIGVTESEAEPNTVIHVLQKGYLLNGRVIRAAMVMVTKAP
jgi:molecular chaperone GrpE